MSISRRSFLAAAGSAALLGAQDSPVVFALLGDRYHNSDHYRTAFGKTFVRDMGVAMDMSDEVKLLNPEHLSRYKVLVVLRDGMVWPNGHGNPRSNAGWWSQGQREIISDPPLPERDTSSVPFIDEGMGRTVKRFVENGGGALLMHNVPYIARYNDDFRDVLGAVTQGHPPVRPFKVRITNRDHPITRGVNDFIVTDEQHYMEYQKDPKYVLAESVNEDGLDYNGHGPKAPAAWAYDYGEGRVVYLGPGHLITAMWNPEYEKMQRNAMRWLLREI